MLSFNKETSELTISPMNGENGLLDGMVIKSTLEQNNINPNEVKSIVVKKGVIAPSVSAYLFSYFQECETMDLKNLDTSQVLNMSFMFQDCISLKALDISNFNTKNVTNMWYMFYNCKSLTTLNLNNIDTKKVTHIGYMFNGCESLITLDLSSFNTKQCEYMYDIFNDCKNLKEVNFGDNCIDLIQEIPKSVKATINGNPIRDF